MSLIQAENTRAFMSAEPAARRMLFGCQSSERTVNRRGFLSRLATHQLFSSSNEQTAIALVDTRDNSTGRQIVYLLLRTDRCHRSSSSHELARQEQMSQHAPSSRRDGELLLGGRPLDVGRRPVDAEDDERRLPDALVVERPDVGVAVLRAGDDPVRLRRPVDGRDELVVLRGEQKNQELSAS